LAQQQVLLSGFFLRVYWEKHASEEDTFRNFDEKRKRKFHLMSKLFRSGTITYFVMVLSSETDVSMFDISIELVPNLVDGAS
jgi:hypothetical protein